jgi:glycosyltransferase involved in cell wall biosynthesis
MPRENIFTGYDAVDNKYFIRRVGEIRNTVGDESNFSFLPRLFFLASARFISKKNLDYLIRSYSAYREEVINGDPWDLVILGDGELKEPLKRLASDLELSQFVHFPGFRQYRELPEFYARAQVFIHASTTEQWGLVVNEAMASGLPVLVSNRCGCASELVVEGVNGHSFDPYQRDELALLMKKISGDLDGLRKMGAASEAIISEWGAERFGRGLEKAIGVAISQPPRKTCKLDKLLFWAMERI